MRYNRCNQRLHLTGRVTVCSCGKACQVAHWKRQGHKVDCARGIGGAQVIRAVHEAAVLANLIARDLCAVKRAVFGQLDAARVLWVDSHQAPSTVDLVPVALALSRIMHAEAVRDAECVSVLSQSHAQCAEAHQMKERLRAYAAAWRPASAHDAAGAPLCVPAVRVGKLGMTWVRDAMPLARLRADLEAMV